MTWQRKPLRGMEPQTFVTKPEGIKRTLDLGDQWWVLRTSCTHCNVLYWGRLTRRLYSEDWNLFSVRGEMIITAQDDMQYKQNPCEQRIARGEWGNRGEQRSFEKLCYPQSQQSCTGGVASGKHTSCGHSTGRNRLGRAEGLRRKVSYLWNTDNKEDNSRMWNACSSPKTHPLNTHENSFHENWSRYGTEITLS